MSQSAKTISNEELLANRNKAMDVAFYSSLKWGLSSAALGSAATLAANHRYPKFNKFLALPAKLVSRWC
jgi:hypothetical protein